MDAVSIFNIWHRVKCDSYRNVRNPDGRDIFAITFAKLVSLLCDYSVYDSISKPYRVINMHMIYR